MDRTHCFFPKTRMLVQLLLCCAAVAISGVVIAAVTGKAGALGAVSEKHALWIERGVGLASGAAIALFGTLFCIANITAVL